MKTFLKDLTTSEHHSYEILPGRVPRQSFPEKFWQKMFWRFKKPVTFFICVIVCLFINFYEEISSNQKVVKLGEDYQFLRIENNQVVDFLPQYKKIIDSQEIEEKSCPFSIKILLQFKAF